MNRKYLIWVQQNSKMLTKVFKFDTKEARDNKAKELAKIYNYSGVYICETIQQEDSQE